MKSRFIAQPLQLALALLLGGALAPAFAADNPMSFVGEKHNQDLACLAEHGRPGVSPLVTLVRHCGLQPAMPVKEFAATFQPLLDADPTLPLAQKMAPFRDRYTDYEFSFFSRIDIVVETAANEKEADAMFAALEQEALSELDLGTFAAQTILGGLSVSRSSLDYWTRYEPIAQGDTAARWPKWLKKLVVVVADVAEELIP